MLITDKKLKKQVFVSDENCIILKCYWARPNPGIFVQGRGYQRFGDERDNQYICGTREIHGCPEREEREARKSKKREMRSKKKKCSSL